MGQLNHCGNRVLGGWLWISGGHHVALSCVIELSEEFSLQGFETPSAQGLDADGDGDWECDSWQQKEDLRFISKAQMFFFLNLLEEYNIMMNNHKTQKSVYKKVI